MPSPPPADAALLRQALSDLLAAHRGYIASYHHVVQSAPEGAVAAHPALDDAQRRIDEALRLAAVARERLSRS